MSGCASLIQPTKTYRLRLLLGRGIPLIRSLCDHLLPQGEKGSGLRRFASRGWYAGGTPALQCGGRPLFFASLGEGCVARRSRVTEGVGAESGWEMTLAVFVTAVTPSDSPSASHLPQEEGLGCDASRRKGGLSGCALLTQPTKTMRTLLTQPTRYASRRDVGVRCAYLNPCGLQAARLRSPQPYMSWRVAGIQKTLSNESVCLKGDDDAKNGKSARAQI
jgi:hypothetical protein